MTVRLSTAFRNLVQDTNAVRRVLSNCYMSYYTTAQPTTADDAAVGQKILDWTKAGGAFTGETRAEWKCTLSGSSGSLNTLKVGGASGWDILGGAYTYASSLTATAAAIAAQINAYIGNAGFTARSDAAVLYVKAPRGTGALLNSLTLVAATTTLTATIDGDATPAGSNGTAGVTAINGLNFTVSAAGVISKETSAWQGTAGKDKSLAAIAGFSSGNLTAGWLRIHCNPADDDSADTGLIYPRIDMSIGTANADMIANPSAIIAHNSPQTINTFSFTLPAE